MLKHFSYILLIYSLTVLLFAGCKKDSDIRITRITIEEVSSYYDGVVRVISEISSDGTPSIDTRGVCYATHSNPTVGDVCVFDSLQMTGKYVSQLTNLTEQTTYYVRAFACNKLGMIYAEEKSFTTPMIPRVSGVTVGNITLESAVCNASIDYNNSITVKEMGFCYNTQGTPSIDNSKAISSVSKSISATLSPLIKGTKYYVRAYVISNIGVQYGEIVSFETKTTPIIETSEATNITKNSAVVSANITSDGGCAITERGICYGESSAPTIADKHINEGYGVGQYSCTITELEISKVYYARAYAKTENGIYYGNEINFIITSTPIVITSAVTSISYTSAVCGGTITSTGGLDVTERGVCWSKTANPTIYSNKISSQLNPFTCTLTDLTDNTTYYVRAYAKNNKGISYGEQIKFTTKSYALPAVTTSPVTNIQYTSAVCGGTVTSTGGLDVSEKGICWSITQNPTISSSKTALGTGIGTFSGSVSGLTDNTTFYVRAYAKNSKGVAYGEQVMFTTQACKLPEVTTTSVTSISYTSALCGGNVTSTGGMSVTERGVCWSTSSNPTILNSKQAVGSGLGKYSTTMSGLLDNTTYYVRAYATNTKGTSYGKEINFTTLEKAEKCKASDYAQVTIGTQTWMAENYICSKYDTQSEAYNASWLTNNTIPTSESYVYTPYYTDATDMTKWKSATYSGNLTSEQIAKLGYLYNWAAAVGVADGQTQTSEFGSNRQGICPNGWHVPSSAEWQTLYDYIYNDQNMSSNEVGKYLKTSSGWYVGSSYKPGTNTYGFAALPAGSSVGNYIELVGSRAFLWASTPYKSFEKWADFKFIYDNADYLYNDSDVKFRGRSVRCIKN